MQQKEIMLVSVGNGVYTACSIYSDPPPPFTSKTKILNVKNSRFINQTRCIIKVFNNYR